MNDSKPSFAVMHMTSEEFRRKRAAMLWTQADAAKGLGLSIAQISAIENGRSAVTKTVALLFGLYSTFDLPGHPGGIGRSTDTSAWTTGGPD